MSNVTRLFDILDYQLVKFPKQDALSVKEDGKWVPTSTQEWADKTNMFSRGLLELGVQPESKIATISNNRPEWHIVDFGILQLGAVNVPIYPTISEEDYVYIFNNAKVEYCIVSDDVLLGKVNAIIDKVPTLKKVFTFNKIDGATHWTEILELGENADQQKVEDLKRKVKPDDLATLIYTSGTTGLPKGVMLTHNNILSNCINSTPRVPVDHTAKALSFLPICHIFERMVVYLYFYNGVSVYFAESLDTISENMREISPEVFTAVPRLLEKVYEKIVDRGLELSGIKKALFFWAIKLGEQWEPYGKNGAFYEFKLSIARKLIFSKWQEALGGNVKAVVSGSAALSPRLARIFWAAGIPVLEGYGLTETSPVIAVNCEKDGGLMMGTVGRLIDNVEVKIADDGEILVKGPNVMKGYYNAPEKTQEAFTEDGYFMTGDIGEFVGDCHLKITDRKKEIFKTSGGKYVAPQPIENKLKGSRFIEQAMVVGEGKKFPSVLIVPQWDNIHHWCQLHDIEFTSIQDMVNNQRLFDRVWKEVDELTKDLGKWERPKKLILVQHEWSVETGELTPTLKLKRKVILKKYHDAIESLYVEAK
tara:strand:+ start:8784 stop:10556 length:1773 start_codon:yes stop_codon:yes gene_type:complete